MIYILFLTIFPKPWFIDNMPVNDQMANMQETLVWITIINVLIFIWLCGLSIIVWKIMKKVL